MRSVRYDSYGGPEVLHTVEGPRPEPGPGQVRVRVRATSINSADVRLMRANPFLVRFSNGLTRPRTWPVLGSDVAGVVDAVGEGVDDLRRGQRVFGNSFQDGLGAFAEYVCVGASALAPMPENVDFEVAAAVPLAGATALQAVRDLGEVGEDMEVLVQGAGGGVGFFLVQLARAVGARVTATCGAANLETVRRLGAERVMDYRREDFTTQQHRYDVIFGVNGDIGLRSYRRCLKPGGRYVLVGGGNRQLFEALLVRSFVFAFSGKSAHVLTLDPSKRSEDLATLRELLLREELVVAVDRRFVFEELPQAMRYVEGGHLHGKVVVAVLG